MRWLSMALLLAGAPIPSYAEPSDLPPEAAVVRALDTRPGVLAAAARVDAARAQGRALRRGPNEIIAQGTLSRRTVGHEGDFAEFDTTVSRAFRLPGKAVLDRSAATLGQSVAESRRGDAHHQAALLLGQLWYDWLRAAELHRNAVILIGNRQALVHATGRRVQLRDAAMLELEQAHAALAQVEAQAADAAADRARARALLEGMFPDLPLPAEPPRLATPAEPPEGLARLQALAVANSHEIDAATGEAERQAVLARRARADRIADPSFGLRVFSERGGQEKGAGLFASFPLGGGHRRASSDQAAAEAAATLADRGRVERDVRANAAADVAEVRARMAAWEASRAELGRAQNAAGLAARGQALGAIDLSDRLNAERQANEARTREIAARAAVSRLILKLRIDAHLLWASPHHAEPEPR